MNFEKLNWKSDRLEIGDFIFSLGQYKSESWNLGNECFVLWKDKVLIDQYKDFFKTYDKPIDNVLELGMWDGGSTALWTEVLEPKKIVGIDHLDKSDTDYFKKWMANKKQTKLSTYWNTNQENNASLIKIISNEFPNSSLDIVIDDASHLYSSTIQSFETIFPLLKPGALYILEDWAWLHWKKWVYQFPKGEEISSLVYKFVQATGSYSNVISSVKVYPGFAVIERGNHEINHGFKIDDNIFLPEYPHEPFKVRLRKAIKEVFLKM